MRDQEKLFCVLLLGAVPAIAPGNQGHIKLSRSGCDEESTLTCATECQFTNAGSGEDVGYTVIQEGWDHAALFHTMIGEYKPFKNKQGFLNVTAPYILQFNFVDCASQIIGAFESSNLYLEINFRVKSSYRDGFDHNACVRI